MSRAILALLLGIAVLAGVIGASIGARSGKPSNQDDSQGQQGGTPAVVLKSFARVVWEAEDCREIEPPMKKVEVKMGDLIGGSGYLEIPDGVNAYEPDKAGDGKTAKDDCGDCKKEKDTADAGEKAVFPGKAVYQVELPEDGEYHLWVRTWWLDGCGDSVLYRIDDGPCRKLAADPTWKTWRWREELSAGKPKTFQLRKGKHTIELRNREDGPRFDQLLLTTDPSNPGDAVIK